MSENVARVGRPASAGQETRTTAGLPPQQIRSRFAGDPGLETGATQNRPRVGRPNPEKQPQVRRLRFPFTAFRVRFAQDDSFIVMRTSRSPRWNWLRKSSESKEKRPSGAKALTLVCDAFGPAEAVPLLQNRLFETDSNSRRLCRWVCDDPGRRAARQWRDRRRCTLRRTSGGG